MEVLIIGNPSDGFTIYGPLEDAFEWAEKQRFNESWWVAELVSPNWKEETQAKMMDMSNYTEDQLRDGMKDGGLTYRIACEDELKRRGLQTRDENGKPI